MKMDWIPKAKELREKGLSRSVIGRIVGRDESSVRRAENLGWEQTERKAYKRRHGPRPLCYGGQTKEDRSYTPPIYRCRECGSDDGFRHFPVCSVASGTVEREHCKRVGA